MRSDEKINFILSFLAKGIYRPWYWQNYARASAQADLRLAWLPVASRYSLSEIRAGLQRWATEKGSSFPPDPRTFERYLAPKMTVNSQVFFSNMRQILGESNVKH